jgi:hypothetical protein
MRLESIATTTMFVAALTSGLGYFSFWWILIPAFFAGSLHLSNGPNYERVVQANKAGNLTFFPLMLATHVLASLAGAAVFYWIVRFFAG